MNVGLQMLDSTIGGLSPTPSHGAGSNVRFDTCAVGIQCKSTQGPGWQFTNFSSGASTFNIQMLTGGGTAPKLRVRGGSFWGLIRACPTRPGPRYRRCRGFQPPGITDPAQCSRVGHCDLKSVRHSHVRHHCCRRSHGQRGGDRTGPTGDRHCHRSWRHGLVRGPSQRGHQAHLYRWHADLDLVWLLMSCLTRIGRELPWPS
jgi:hypothetical protein